VIEHVLKRLVALGECAESLVEDTAVGFLGVAQLAQQIAPTGALGDEEYVVEVRVLTILLLCLFFRDRTLLDLAANDLFALGVEYVGAALQEQQPEDVVLVRGRI
jgi:hypothetical protein